MITVKDGACPDVSVVVVNWNGAGVLERCLSALSSQTFKDFEVIVVDNGSQDGSLDLLERHRSGIHLVKLRTNQGFAGANNVGARTARGQWLALLNNDAFPEPTWLEEILAARERNPDFTFFASCLRMARQPDLIDGLGDDYHISGLAWRKGHGRRYHREELTDREVFGACAAAALFPRQLFLELEGFDEDYFCYHEDVDLSFRFRLAGHRCLCASRAVIFHLGSSSSGQGSDFALYHGHRNLVWTFFKNMPSSLLAKYLPLHAMANVLSLLWFLKKGQSAVLWKAKKDAFKSLGAIWEKRSKIQQKKKVGSAEIARVLDHGWIKPYRLALTRR